MTDVDDLVAAVEAGEMLHVDPDDNEWTGREAKRLLKRIEKLEARTMKLEAQWDDGSKRLKWLQKQRRDEARSTSFYEGHLTHLTQRVNELMAQLGGMMNRHAALWKTVEELKKR